MRKHSAHILLFVIIALVAFTSLSANADPAKQDVAKNDEVAALKKLIQEQNDLIKQLTDRVTKLEQGQNGGAPAKNPEEPEIPPIEIPSAGKETPGASTAPVSRASLMPDLSVIGNNIGRFNGVRGDSERNRLQMGEFEIGLQQPVYPGIRFDAFITGDPGGNFSLSAEEAFATINKIGHLPFGGYLGLKRLDFGKVNPVHPHARPYADQPSVVSAFLGGDGLSGDGAALTYLLPVKNVFANLEVGMWNTSPAEDGITTTVGEQERFYPVGPGASGNLPLARLWMSKDVNRATELEFGASHAFGRADFGDRVNITGLDLTYRTYPASFKRLLLQGEVMWHHRADLLGGTGGHTRSGHYLLATWQPDQYYEYGIRYDNTKFPWPIEGHDRAISFIWSNKLTEVTTLRLQFKHGDRTDGIFLPASGDYNEFWVQFLWGAGSHTHALQ